MRVSIRAKCLLLALVLPVWPVAGEDIGNLLAAPSMLTACYACATPLEALQATAAGPSVKTLASFESDNPFSGGVVVTMHATSGTKALRIDRSYASIDQRADWRGYDYLKAELFTDARKPMSLDVEIRDTGTRDYWTRVNYTTIVPPGKSTLIIPVKQLYVGEKSRPGRMLNLSGITRLVFGIGDNPPAPLFLDNVRLERDDSTARVHFEGLLAFDFGTDTSPVMEGFTAITPATQYSRSRGYGLKNARIWHAFDALQPEPLYQDFICIEAGGLAVDLPNGKYRVFVNFDSPSGFWGEYQTFRKRAILAEGRPVVRETMDFDTFKVKYFRFWNVDDLPTDNTFDKYQKAYFHEKRFDVDLTDGQLNLEFQGENWACCVSAVVIFPVEKAAQGQAFLEFVEAGAGSISTITSSAFCHLPPATRSGRANWTSAAASWSSSAIRCRMFPITTHRGSGRSATCCEPRRSRASTSL